MPSKFSCRKLRETGQRFESFLAERGLDLETDRERLRAIYNRDFKPRDEGERQRNRYAAQGDVLSHKDLTVCLTSDRADSARDGLLKISTQLLD